MNCTRILDNTDETITAQMETGLSDVVVNIRRRSDGYYLDWTDDTFKASGWTTKDASMTEVGSTGQYEIDFELSNVTNRVNDDIYVVSVASATSDYSPQIGEIKAGDYVDNLDASVASVKSQTDQINFNGGNVQARVNDKGVLNDPSAADIDSQLSGAHGAGDWQKPNSSELAGGVWDADISSHLAGGTFGAKNQRVVPSENADDYKADVSALALEATAQGIKTQTDKLQFDGSNNVQARVNDKGVLNDPSAADIDTELSGTHGAGNWETSDPAAIITELDKIIALLGRWCRRDNVSHDANGNITAGQVRGFGNQADYDANVNPIITIDYTGTVLGGFQNTLRSEQA